MIESNITVDQLNSMNKGSMGGHIGIEFMDIGENFISARMPVDHRTKQPLGLLHGGASVALAETLGSVAATFTIDRDKYYCVGLEINANHVRSVKDGYIYGITKPIHIGKRTQIWEIKITDENDQLVNISRLTLAVIEKK